jgi:hypothetical protein
MRNIFLGIEFVLLLAISPAFAEKVHIKYRDADVDLGKFECHEVIKGPEVRRICYDKPNGYLVIRLHNTYYHYCEIDEATVKGLQSAASPDDYYHKSVRGHFDCRTHRIPKY